MPPYGSWPSKDLDYRDIQDKLRAMRRGGRALHPGQIANAEADLRSPGRSHGQRHRR